MRTMMSDEVHSERVEAIRSALMRCEGVGGSLHICHGSPWCNSEEEAECPCKWCHTFHVDEGTTAEQVEAELLKVQRGH